MFPSLRRLEMNAESLTYAQRRALNIARNAERMRAIGLTTIHFADLIGDLGPASIVQNQKRSILPSSERSHCDLNLRRSGRTSGRVPRIRVFCVRDTTAFVPSC